MNGDFALRRRGFNLRPVGVGMAPEGTPPGGIELIQCLVTLFYPVPKLRLTRVTMAIPAVFIGDMPAYYGRMMAVTLRQLLVDGLHFHAINRRREAVIVPSAVQRFHPVTADTQHFRVALRHPGRPRKIGRAH